MFPYKNNSPRWVIKQILTQVEKQKEINNGNNNNNSKYDDNNSINDNSFMNENNCQAPKKQLSFITLPYKGQQVQQVYVFYQIT